METNDTTNSDRFLTARECEALTTIPEGTLRYWASVGRGPASFKLGRRRVWRESTIRAWIAEQEKSTTTGGEA